MSSSKNVIGTGYSHPINVTFMNYGVYTETLNVTIYANATLVAQQTVVLASGNSTGIGCMWNTTGFAKGNYTLSAHVVPDAGETYTADNTLMLGPIAITIPGDVDGNFIVNIFDVVKITSCYGKTQIDPIYYPNADIDGNGVINIFDVVICTGHYGQKWP